MSSTSPWLFDEGGLWVWKEKNWSFWRLLFCFYVLKRGGRSEAVSSRDINLYLSCSFSFLIWYLFSCFLPRSPNSLPLLFCALILRDTLSYVHFFFSFLCQSKTNHKVRPSDLRNLWTWTFSHCKNLQRNNQAKKIHSKCPWYIWNVLSSSTVPPQRLCLRVLFRIL